MPIHGPVFGWSLGCWLLDRPAPTVTYRTAVCVVNFLLEELNRPEAG
jgi:hypothetical protein